MEGGREGGQIISQKKRAPSQKNWHGGNAPIFLQFHSIARFLRGLGNHEKAKATNLTISTIVFFN